MTTAPERRKSVDVKLWLAIAVQTVVLVYRAGEISNQIENLRESQIRLERQVETLQKQLMRP